MAPREDDDKPFKSSLGMRYPTLRDNFFKDGDMWLASKKMDDNYGNLWRIHDGLYDVSSFIKNHPGGPEWLEWTQGTDITELFELHHISTKPEELLPKFFVRNADTPRDVPFHFEEDGFFRTMKREVREVLKDLPKWPPMLSKFYIDSLLLGYVVLATLAAVKNNYWLATLAAIFLGGVAIASHNFSHMKNNFRMYYMNFTVMSWRDWRLTHVISHHVYPNTINDLELWILEPFLQYLPGRKGSLYQWCSVWFQPVFYAIFLPLGYIKMMLHKLLWKTGLISYKAPLFWDDFLPFAILIPMSYLSNLTFKEVFLMFVYIMVINSIHFGIIGLNAGHRDPELFLDGDAPRPKEEQDWGVFQMDTLLDKTDISKFQFTILTGLGDHAVHHLFPTLDHGLLKYLHPIFEKNLKKFGVNLLIKPHLEVMKTQCYQLLKTEPKTQPPKPLLITSARFKTE